MCCAMKSLATGLTLLGVLHLSFVSQNFVSSEDRTRSRAPATSYCSTEGVAALHTAPPVPVNSSAVPVNCTLHSWLLQWAAVYSSVLFYAAIYISVCTVQHFRNIMQEIHKFLENFWRGGECSKVSVKFTDPAQDL
jgi:hypothetical protein